MYFVEVQVTGGYELLECPSTSEPSTHSKTRSAETNLGIAGFVLPRPVIRSSKVTSSAPHLCERIAYLGISPKNSVRLKSPSLLYCSRRIIQQGSRIVGGKVLEPSKSHRCAKVGEGVALELALSSAAVTCHSSYKAYQALRLKKVDLKLK